MIFTYIADIPRRSFQSTPSESANVKELLSKLEETKLLDHYKRMDTSANNKAVEKLAEQNGAVQVDVKNGIFVAHTDEQHRSLIDQLDHLAKFGLLDDVFDDDTDVKSTSIAENSKLTIAPDPVQRTHADQLVHEDAIKKLIAEIKLKYSNGYPLSLSQAFKQHCVFRQKAATPDEKSRLKNVIDFIGDLNLHELTPDLFVNYKKLKLTPTNGDKPLSVRTVDERIALVRHLIETLIDQGVYRGDNPLGRWTRSTSSKAVKDSADEKIASIATINSVFGSNEYLAFGAKHPAHYLVTTIAVVTGMRISSICSLKSTNFIITEDGVHCIELFRSSKTLAGKRQIPIPVTLFEAAKQFLTKHRDSFGFVARTGKGYSDSFKDVTDKFFQTNSHFDPELLNPHGLRAALNDHMLKCGVQLDVRCSLIGHSMGHVNSKYMSGVPTAIVHKNVHPIQNSLLMGLRFDQFLASGQTKFARSQSVSSSTTRTSFTGSTGSPIQINTLPRHATTLAPSSAYRLMIDPLKPSWTLM